MYICVDALPKIGLQNVCRAETLRVRKKREAGAVKPPLQLLCVLCVPWAKRLKNTRSNSSGSNAAGPLLHITAHQLVRDRRPDRRLQLSRAVEFVQFCSESVK